MSDTTPSAIHQASPRFPLALDAGGRSHLGAEVVAAVDRFLDELDRSPASFGATDRRQIDQLLSPPPEQGASDVGGLLKTIFTAAQTGIDTASGSQLSYIPNGGLYAGALGRFIGASLNRWTGAAFANPGAVALEQSVIDWMITLFDLGPSAAGLLLSGGSLATLEAVVAARTRLGDRFHDAVVYTSEQSHHSVAKAARLAGIPATGVRLIPTDRQMRIDTAILERAVEDDRADGHRPMMLVATAGTTDTGSIDPLMACADIAAANDLWFHVDAAYGGFFMLTERGRAMLSGIERADSITVDAHKGLQIPYGVGGLLVADRQNLLEANVGRGAYMQDCVDDAQLPDYSALGAELTRPFRGLDVWLPLHLHGVSGFRNELDRVLDLARRAADRIQTVPGIDVVIDPTLSIVGFRCTAGDAATAAVLAHLNQSAEVHVSSTTVAGRLTIRFAFLNYRTTTAIADRAVDLVAEAMARQCSSSCTDTVAA